MAQNRREHEQMLETLTVELHEARADLDRLRRDIAAAEDLHRRLLEATSAIRSLLDPRVERERTKVDGERVVRRILTKSGASTIASASHEPIWMTVDGVRVADAKARPVPPPVPNPAADLLKEATEAADSSGRRYPSTDWVTAVVRDAGRPMRREEVIDEVERRFGLPAEWTNVSATIGVALQRASQDDGQLERIDRGLYAPAGWTKKHPEVRVPT